jgi:magnesium transporter
MPELNSKYGYFITLTLMGVIAFVEVLYFKKKKWL